MWIVKSNISEKFVIPGNRRVKIPAIICNQMIEPLDKELLSKYKDIFSLDEYDIGHTDNIQHLFCQMKSDEVKVRHRRISSNMYDEVYGIIRESSSP